METPLLYVGVLGIIRDLGASIIIKEKIYTASVRYKLSNVFLLQNLRNIVKFNKNGDYPKFTLNLLKENVKKRFICENPNRKI